jgi:hemerythrin-like domain-containing protein
MGNIYIHTDLSLKDLAKTDPIKRNVEKGLEQVENSPMDPPSAYANENSLMMDKEISEKSIKIFKEEHTLALEVIEKFEIALIQFKENGYRFNTKINEDFKVFFDFLDNNLFPHNNKEEKALFPILHKRLIEAGEHSTGNKPRTAIDVMEDDHVKFIQLGVLTFNFLGLASRLKDDNSRMFVYDTAYENGRELVELLKLHIYREDHVLFPLAQKHLSRADFDQIELEMDKL